MHSEAGLHLVHQHQSQPTPRASRLSPPTSSISRKSRNQASKRHSKDDNQSQSTRDLDTLINGESSSKINTPSVNNNNNQQVGESLIEEETTTFHLESLPNREDESDIVVAGRQRQRDLASNRVSTSEARKRTRHEHKHSSTSSTVSDSSIHSLSSSSPPPLSASTSTTPSSAASSIAPLFPRPAPFHEEEESTSPCSSESANSLLSLSTFSSPTSSTYSVKKITAAKMTASTSSTTETTRRSANAQHTRNISNGSTASTTAGDREDNSNSNNNSLRLSSSSSAAARRSGRKSATPSAINIAAANNAASSSKSTANPSTSDSTSTSNTSAKQAIAISSALSGLLSPTSASNLTSAQQSALEKALAAGISRDEFEKTRASVVSMLRGANASGSGGNGTPVQAQQQDGRRSVTPQPLLPASDSTSADNSFMQNASASDVAGSEETLAGASQRSFEALPKLAISTSSRREGASSSRSNRYSGLNSASTSQTALSEQASTAPSTAASTLRTSVSSSNDAEDLHNLQDGGNDHESPTTSDDGAGLDIGESMQADIDTKELVRQSTPVKDAGSLNNALGDPYGDVNMLSSSTKSVLSAGLDEDEEEDSSFNAATAAAAALGMLASSPVKVIERRQPSNYPITSTSQQQQQQQQQPFMNGASGMFSQHRGHPTQQGLVSSSSPPLAAAAGRGSGNNQSLAGPQGLTRSSSGSNGHLYSSPPNRRGAGAAGAGGSSSRSPLDFNPGNSSNRNIGNDSSDLSAEGLVAAATLGASSVMASGGDRDKLSSTTTPVRTRLEDIALKSSAQIRRQREILGLGEEEMMDLDTDLRHENALLRGQFDNEDDEVVGREERFVDDEDEQILLSQSPRKRQSSRRRQQQPQSGHLDERDLQQSGMGLQGLAPAFSYPYTSSSSSTASAGRQASRSPSRPVPNGREGRPAHGRRSSRQAAGPSSSTYFSPSKLTSSHLPSSAQASASSSTAVSGGGASAPSTSRRRGQHHRRVSSYGMSGMMDRFMESNYSPKAAQIAKFEDAVRRASPERERGHPVPSSSSAYDTDRTLMHATRDDDDEEEEEDVYYEDVEDEDGEGEREDVTVHSTPRTHMDKTRLLRSAGNDLPSPLLQQIRMLSDADNSPHHSAERPHRERETPRFARGPTGYSARQELGLSSGHASSSEFGSARKRKASYDLQSPRHMVRNVQASPAPEEDEDGDRRDPRDLRTALSPPPPFRNFAQSDAKFFERTTAGHPSSSGLFDGPTPSHSQSSSQSSAASYRLSQSQPQSSQHAQRHAYPQPHHQQQLHHSQQHPQVHHQHPQHAQQYARHYADDAHIPQPLYGHPSQQHPPSSAERHHPTYYQQYPRHLDGADELSQYALAPPRPPSHHHMHGNLQASQMSRPGSVNSDYIPNQRELKKKEKTMKKGHSAPRERQESVSSSIASGPVAAPSSSTAGTSTLDNFVPSNVQVGQYDEKTKPPFSYAALIGQAIFSTPNRRMSLADIYTYIMTLYPIYKKQDAGWQNSIRHNLSLNECFVKTQRGPDEPGKGCLWSIFPGTEEQFTGGNFYKKGKVPKSALRQGGGGGGGGPASSIAPSSNDGSGKRKKANSVASGTETMSVMSADDSFETQSANSFSYASNSSLMQSQGYADAQRPPHQYAQHPAYVHQAYPGQQYHPASQPHGPSSLRQKQQLQYSDEIEPEEVYEEEDDEAIDMDNPPPRYARPEQHAHRPAQRYQQGQEDDLHRAKLVVRHSKGVGDPKDETTALPPKRESSAEGEGEPMSQTASDYDGEDVFNATEAEHSYSNSDRSGSMEPVKRHQAMPHTSPVRRGNPYDRQRALLTSPPIMSSPPTNVFARMSQPYQPLRTSFNIPSSNAHAEALMSSPPPSSGIMPSDVRMRQLPPPTPRRASADGDEHAGSHIFLPAPNIKPGKSTFGKKEGTDEDAKPTLPPIHMMSPASAMALNTQSPVSSIRGSAAHNRSSSPSPKSSSLPSSSGNSITRSPTLNKSRQLHPSEVFKTPDRFAAPSSRTINSPNKLAHLANNNASKALQSLQTPKLGTSRAGHGLVTPGGYYDPYEYGAVLDEELDRMMATNKDEGGRSDRRPLPFPSPIDRTPKWQPWSPW